MSQPYKDRAPKEKDRDFTIDWKNSDGMVDMKDAFGGAGRTPAHVTGKSR